jgi:hypothetical protein
VRLGGDQPVVLERPGTAPGAEPDPANGSVRQAGPGWLQAR